MGGAALGAVHDLANVLDYHSARSAARLAGARQPVQELAKHRVLYRAVLGHAIAEVGRVGVAYIMEGDGQPAPSMGSGGLHEALQVGEGYRTRAVDRDRTQLIGIRRRNGFYIRRGRREIRIRDASAKPGIIEPALLDYALRGRVVGAKGISERLRVGDAVADHVLPGAADLAGHFRGGQRGEVGVVDGMRADIVALCLQSVELVPGHAALEARVS